MFESSWFSFKWHISVTHIFPRLTVKPTDLPRGQTKFITFPLALTKYRNVEVDPHICFAIIPSGPSKWKQRQISRSQAHKAHIHAQNSHTPLLLCLTARFNSWSSKSRGKAVSRRKGVKISSVGCFRFWRDITNHSRVNPKQIRGEGRIFHPLQPFFLRRIRYIRASFSQENKAYPRNAARILPDHLSAEKVARERGNVVTLNPSTKPTHFSVLSIPAN